MGVNSLPRTVTRQRRGCDLNPGPSAPESSMLTTRLPSQNKTCSVQIIITIQTTNHGICRNSTLDGCRADGRILSKLAAGDDVDRQVNLNVLLLGLVHHLRHDLRPFFIEQRLPNLQRTRQMQTLDTIH